MNDVFFWISVFGIVVFAISGALMALRQGMDLVGVGFVATVTGIGGGTFRDVVLGFTPLPWVTNPWPIALCLLAALGCSLLNSVLQGSRMRWLLYADAIGLAMFCVLGAQRAEMAGAHPLVIILLSALSASFGGIVRDVICNEPPLLLRQEIYILAAMLGAAVYLLLPESLGPELRLLSGAGAALALRVPAIWWHWSLNFPKALPPIEPDARQKGEQEQEEPSS